MAIPGGTDESGGGDGATERKPTILQKMSDTVNDWLAAKFYRLGEIIVDFPLAGIGITIVVFFIMAALAATQFEKESRGDKLWIPQNTRAVSDAEYYDARYPRDSLINNVYMTKKSGDTSNALTYDGLTTLLSFHTAFETITSSTDPDIACRPSHDDNGNVIVTSGSGGGTCSYRSLCSTITYSSGGATMTGCRFHSILDFFTDQYGNYSQTEIDNANSANGVIAHINAKLNSNAIASDGSPLSIGGSLGGITYAANGDITAAKVLSLAHFFANNPSFDEKEARSEDVNVESFFEKVVDKVKSTNDGDNDWKIDLFNDFYFSQEFGKAIGADVMLLNIGILLLIIFSSVAISKIDWTSRPKVAEYRGSLAIIGVLTSGFAIAASFGFSSLCGFPYTPLHGSLPFILLGIGVDDMFVIVFAFDKIDSTLPLKTRVAKALQVAGTSVLVTSFTDFIAFMIGATTLLPALSSFCFWAGVGIMFDFIFFVTFFVACLVLDTRRRESGACCLPDSSKCTNVTRILCCAPCCGSTTKSAASGPGPSPGSKAVLDKVLPWLMSTTGNIVVTTVVVALLIPGIIGVVQVKMDFNLSWFLPDDSPVQDYIRISDDHFNVGDQISFVIKENTDYVSSKTTITALSTAIANNQYVSTTMTPTVTSWFDAFVADTTTFPADTTTLNSDLTTYLYNPTAAYNGTRFLTDFGRNGLTKNTNNDITAIAYSKFTTWTKSADDANEQLKMMDSLRSIGDGSSLDVVVHAESFVFTEQFRVIQDELYRNLALAVVCIFFVTALLIAHPGAALLVTINVIITLVDVLGFASLAGYSINSVTAIYMILAIGLTVDYSAHVAHHFMMHHGTRTDRAIAAIEGVGVSVLCGGTSTFIAVLVLAFSSTYIFNVFFIMFLFTCMFGLFHGLLFLPIVLSKIGPPPFTRTMHDEPAAAPKTVEAKTPL